MVWQASGGVDVHSHGRFFTAFQRNLDRLRQAHLVLSRLCRLIVFLKLA
jgi:hypothetical protein